MMKLFHFGGNGDRYIQSKGGRKLPALVNRVYESSRQVLIGYRAKAKEKQMDIEVFRASDWAKEQDLPTLELAS